MAENQDGPIWIRPGISPEDLDRIIAETRGSAESLAPGAFRKHRNHVDLDLDVRPIFSAKIQDAQVIDFTTVAHDDLWGNDEYRDFLKRIYTTASGYWLGNELVGYTILSSREHGRNIDRIVVAKKYQRLGIGRLMMDSAKETLVGKKTVLTCTTRDSSELLPLHLFLRDAGFIVMRHGGGKIVFRYHQF